MIRNPLSQALRGLQLAGTRFGHEIHSRNVIFITARKSASRFCKGCSIPMAARLRRKDATCRIQLCHNFRATQRRCAVSGAFARRRGVLAQAWSRRSQDPAFANGKDLSSTAMMLMFWTSVCRKRSSPFRLRRKAEIYEKIGGGRPMRFIKNIEYAGEEETQCMQRRGA